MYLKQISSDWRTAALEGLHSLSGCSSLNISIPSKGNELQKDCSCNHYCVLYPVHLKDSSWTGFLEGWELCVSAHSTLEIISGASCTAYPWCWWALIWKEELIAPLISAHMDFRISTSRQMQWFWLMGKKKKWNAVQEDKRPGDKKGRVWTGAVAFHSDCK